MRRLLLVSTSATHDSGYLDHCAGQVRELFEGCENLLFVPYALHDRDGYADRARARFREMGFVMHSIHRAADPAEAVGLCDGIFIGGGNTFRLLASLYEKKLIQPIRKRVGGGLPYMGTSAGSNVACATIRTTNDMPIVQPPSFEALALVPFQINPHYLDADPSSRHMGETRETRLREFLEENDNLVVGLREGAMLRIRGSQVRLVGTRGARLFRRGAEPEEYEPGADLDFLTA